MAADVTLKIDADTARYIAKIAAASEDTLKLTRHTKGIAGQWEHVNEHMGRTLLRGTAIVEIFDKAAEAVNKFAEKSSEINKSSGGDALQRATALSKLGMSGAPGFDSYVTSLDGAASNKERGQALGQLASFSEETHIPVSARMVSQYVALMSSGLFSAEELLKMLRQGRPLPGNEEIERRLKDLTPEAREEISQRTHEHQTENRKDAAYANSGGKNRYFDAEREAREAEHPGGYGVVNTAEGLPGIGGLAKAAEREQGTSGSTLNAFGVHSAAEYLRAIRDNTKGSPSLNLPGNGER